MFKIIIFLLTIIHSGNFQNPKIGLSINLFRNYGFLTRTMRVLPINSQPGIFNETTTKIFDSISISPPEERKVSVFDGDIKIEFCEDEQELLEAYFRNFTIEYLDEPWHAFVENRTASSILNIFGLDQAAASEQFSYILIKVARFREHQKLGTHLILSQKVNQGTEILNPEKFTSALKFIDKFGSHYIESFVTGDQLFQVFAFTPEKFEEVKQKFIKFGVKNVLKHYRYFFSPKFADFISPIQAASGNSRFENWTKKLQELGSRNLLKIFDLKLLKLFNAVLENEALLSLNLKSIAPFLENESKRKFLEEFLYYNSQLWKVNM